MTTNLRRVVIERARLLAEDDGTDYTKRRRKRRRRRGETAKLGFPRRRPVFVIERERRLDGVLSPEGHR